MTLARACRRLFAMAIRDPSRLEGLGSIAPFEFWERDGLLYCVVLIAIYEPHVLPHCQNDTDIINILDLALWKASLWPLSREEFRAKSLPIIRELERIGA